VKGWLLIFAAFALFLTGMVYVGYANEQLKAVLEPWQRGVLMVGFVIGIGTVCRFLAVQAVNSKHPKR
jgi:hypothetical protein